MGADSTTAGQVGADGALIEPAAPLSPDAGPSSVITNAVWLFLQQGLTYLLPLVTFPYLARVLGVERFGLVALGQAFAGYSILMTEYGFALWATREVSLVRDDREALSALFSGVLATKLVLAMAGFAIALGVIAVVPSFHREMPFFVLSYLTVFGYALLPDWLFQGMEKMRLATIATVTARLIFALSIFALVREPGDYMLVPAANAAGFVIAGFLGVWIGVRQFRLRFLAPSRRSIRRCLHEARHIFYSRLSSGVYAGTTTLILGIFAPTATVGRYAAAERVTSAGAGLSNPLNQALYPYLSRQRRETDPASYRRDARLLAGGMTLVFAALALAILVVAARVVKLVFGNPDPQAVLILRIITPTVLLGPMGAYLTQLVIIEDRSHILSRILGVAAVFHVLILFLVVPRAGVVGLCIAVVVVQAVVVLSVAAATDIFKRSLRA